MPTVATAALPEEAKKTRHHIILEREQGIALQELSKQSGIPFSHFVRKAVREMLETLDLDKIAIL